MPASDARDLDMLWRDEKHWNASMLYFCKQDPRLFVPKAVRWSGYTINLAHPWAPAALLAVIVLPTLLVAMPRASAFTRRVG